MVKELCSCEIYSHPDKYLYNHLFNVGSSSAREIKKKNLTLNDFGLSSDILDDITYILGICHDFGKSTSYFQDYLFEEDPKKKLSLKSKKEYHHGLLSAVFTYYILNEYNQSINNDLGYFPLIGYVVVKKHHGDLATFEDEINDLVDENVLDTIKIQIDSIDSNQIKKLYNQLLLDYNLNINVDIDYFFNNFESVVNEIHRPCRRNFFKKLKDEQSTGYQLITQFFYSILISSDKLDASSIRISAENNTIPSDLVDNYKSAQGYDKNDTKMNKIRNEIYDDVINNAWNLNLDNKIYSINVPTGTGKTLTSFSFALKLRQRLVNEKGYTPKIIYSLPFLSIIDQNYDVFEDVFYSVLGKKPSSDILLKHHHLSDIYYTTNKNEEYDPLDSLSLIEGWNSEIIVTTFVQYFHSIFSNKNRSLKKFHNIANSIVILDEVQSIPHKYWYVLKQVLSAFAKYLNTYFVFVTATLPLVFDTDNGEITELVSNKDEYFKQLDRINLEPELNPMHIGEFKEFIGNEISNNPDKDILIVLNTIKSSLEVYKYLKDLEFENTTYYYLSTNVIPKDRMQKIRNIKYGHDTINRKVIVTTQLVEAGVDIDVDLVYRDFAPIDSINQISGRCNRNILKNGKGLVKILNLKDDNKEFHKYIYSSFLTNATKQVLSNQPYRISETDFLSLSTNYFKKVKDLSSDDKSIELIDYINKLQFDELASNFQLIDDENYRKIDVFVELDDKAVSIWQKYNQVLDIKDRSKRKEEYLKIKKIFNEYLITVPEKDFSCEIFDELGIGYIPKDQLEYNYDRETGFILEPEADMIF